MGAAALEGRPGVISVGKGWLGRKEVNRVVFDPEKVTVDAMVTWLKKAGTYTGTPEDPRWTGQSSKRGSSP